MSRRTGVSVHTIRQWRRRGPPRTAGRIIAGAPTCPNCGLDPHPFAALPGATYAYALGVYLGDGTIGRAKSSWSLRVSLDSRYPGIVAESAAALEALCGRKPRVHMGSRTESYVVVTSNWKGWPCLFPQHGPGRKHTRPIVLTDWQRQIVDAEPGSLLRGLIHTDGWRGENRVRSKGKEYVYPRYQFSNRSDDIRVLFTGACDALGIAWAPWTRFHVSVARRDAVARLDAFVGPKA